MLDSKVSQDSLDRCYIAANIDIEKIEGIYTPSDSLNRFKFLEVIVRIAKAKYIETGLTKSYPDAIQLLMDNNILKFDQSEGWQKIREEKIWTVQVNDLLEANIPALRKVYESYF